MLTSVWFWQIFLFASGAIFGFVMYRLFASQKAELLAKQLEQSRAELADYRQQVYVHFKKTAQLVNAVSASCQEAYSHLVKGAQTLCAHHYEPESYNHHPAVENLATSMTQQRGLHETAKEE